jgi:hypothetical protein
LPMPLCEVVRRRDPLLYITQFQGSRQGTAPLAPWMTRFVDYFNIPYFYSYDFNTVNMWLGFANDTSAPLMTNAHFDGTDNLFVMLSGRKTFYLWDPSSARGMYTHCPVEHVSPSGHMTLGSPPNKDMPRDFVNSHVLKRSKTAQVPILRRREDPYVSASGRAYSAAELRKLFPLYFSNTTRAVCEVREGDAIYFPGCYFHEVHSSGGRHLGINFWMMYEDGLSADSSQQPDSSGSSSGSGGSGKRTRRRRRGPVSDGQRASRGGGLSGLKASPVPPP